MNYHSGLSAGVVLLIHIPKLFPAHMGINLCRSNLAVSEHELDRPEIRPSFQEMSGK
jgi:hypothetical protein